MDEGFPTLRECWQDVHNWEDFKEFFPLLVPLPIYRFYKMVRHPRRWLAIHRKNKWCYSRKVGDIVCNCGGQHGAILTIGDDRDTVVTADGFRCSLYHCCSPVEPDNTCHSPPLDEPCEV